MPPSLSALRRPNPFAKDFGCTGCWIFISAVAAAAFSPQKLWDQQISIVTRPQPNSP
uniref:Polyadenylate-binding protein-interacting protein 3 n=1 Tax=Rhizophora mucronata TaxID=61149 RepID=A0A2P2MIZ1_RHIMU